MIGDASSKECMYRELADFRRACATGVHDYVWHPMTASDGGLVCFVPRRLLLTDSILVGNPFTDEWKALPCIPLRDKETPTNPRWPNMVQLLGEEDTKCYRVLVVSSFSE